MICLDDDVKANRVSDTGIVYLYLAYTNVDSDSKAPSDFIDNFWVKISWLLLIIGRFRYSFAGF